MSITRWHMATIGVGLVLALGIGLTLVLSKGEEEDHAWQQAQTSGVMRVGMDAAYPPFENVNEQNEIVGFDVDFATEIGRRLGLEVTFINMAYDGLYDALLTGQVEVLISALAVIPQYEGKALYSTPYFNAGEYLVVRDDASINQMEDLSGLMLAVEYGSGGDVEARKWQRRLEAMEVMRSPDPTSALQAVVDGQADAALVDGITARLGVGQHPELKLSENVVETLYAIAVHPDSTTLLNHIDAVLWEMLEDGTVDSLIEKWFGPQ